jgi:ectoine hydroxylase-related dioxygenase (phytanoyl-CoA dioxygenase family)
MDIGDWKSVAGMAEVYRRARDFDLEPNIAELEAFGFTVIEPDKTGAPKGFSNHLLEAVMEIARQQDESVVDLNKHADRPAYGRQLFHLLAQNPLFVDAAMNPVVRTMASYMLGLSMKFFSMVAFIKEGPARPTPMHTDSVGVPSPLPFYGTVCNISWILSDYTQDNGTLCMVPGSHRFCRHPTEFEQPKFMGGVMDDAMATPVIAKPGSIAVFTGNTWHGTYPKVTPTTRVHIATAFCRNYVSPAENYDDLSDDVLAKNDPELARLIGRKAWQGYRAEGPKLENMALVRPANQSVYG